MLEDPGVAALKASLFKALAHPLRVQILEVLADGERAVGVLAELLGMELSHLSQQLAVLRRADLVATRRVASVVYYRLRDPHVTQLLFLAREVLVASLHDFQLLLHRSDAVADPT